MNEHEDEGILLSMADTRALRDYLQMLDRESDFGIPSRIQGIAEKLHAAIPQTKPRKVSA